MKQQNNPIVSIIIPSFNEATYIGRLLDQLSCQTSPAFEVIVSDAESEDGIKAVIDSHKDRLTIRLIESPPKGPGAGRNVGATLAQGEWLLFLDADDEIDDPDFIQTMVRVATECNWQTASAKVAVKNASWSEKIGIGLNYKYTKLLARTKHPVAPGWCILTKRQVFEDNGGFNQKIQFGEDYDYVSRVAKYGFGFIEQTYYYTDLRRVREEGWRFIYKGVANEIYRHTHGYKLDSNPYKYEFGKHKERQ